MIIPISVALPSTLDAEETGDYSLPQLTLCGDINQRQYRYLCLEMLLTIWYLVGPLVVSNEARAAELEVSLLERLFERPLYADHKENGCAALISHETSILPYTTLVKVKKDLETQQRYTLLSSQCAELPQPSSNPDATFRHIL